MSTVTDTPPQMAVVPFAEKQPLLVRMLERFVRPKTSPQNLPPSTGGFYMVNQSAGYNVQGKQNAYTYRMLSTAPWVRAAIDIRRDQVSSAEWDIVPYRNTGGRTSKRLAQEIRERFEQPNPVDGSFQPFIQRVIEDILVLDAGVVEKVRFPTGDIAELWPTPGEFIGVNPRWDGSDPEAARYYWYPEGFGAKPTKEFTNEDMIYMMQNPRTNSVVGMSPIEVLKMTIDSELQAGEYNRRQVMGAAPNGVLNIGESALDEDVKKARSYWQTEVLGQSAMGIIGGYKSPSWMKFSDTNREMQFREWQDFLVRQIAIVFGLSPMDLGITFDVNRSTAEQGAQNTEDRGLRPLMSLMQDYFTREVVWDQSFGGKENNLAFRWTALNLKETKAKADINKIAMAGVAWKTANEARIDDGRPPIGDINDETNLFNHVLMSTPTGLLDLTDEKFIGQEQMVGLQTDAKKELADQAAENASDAADHQADINSDAAEQQAKLAPKPAPAGGSKK